MVVVKAGFDFRVLRVSSGARGPVLHALAATLATLAAAVMLPVGASRPSVGGHPATGCVRANVGGRIDCLAPGRPCLTPYERVYRFYGLTCGVARQDGAYRLEQRTYIGPPRPSARGRARASLH